MFDLAFAVTLQWVVSGPQHNVVEASLQRPALVGVSDKGVARCNQVGLEGHARDARVQTTAVCQALPRDPVIDDYRIGLEAQLEPAR